MTIDPEDYQIAMDQAQANLADAEATAASSHWNVPITSVTVKSIWIRPKPGCPTQRRRLKRLGRTMNLLKASLAQAQANAA